MPKRLGGKEIGTPAGGILSTIQDLHIWNNALYGGKILKPETLQLFMAKVRRDGMRSLGRWAMLTESC